MNNEQQQIIDEAYENYITQTRIEFEKWRERNPDTLVDYREDTKELFLKSIKEDTHWFTGEKKFSEKWGLKIEERELSDVDRQILLEQKGRVYQGVLVSKAKNYKRSKKIFEVIKQTCDEFNIPTKQITITYNDKTIESHE